MLELIAADIVTKIKAISTFNSRVGLSIGGREIDPMLENLALPAAWVLYTDSINIDDRADGACISSLMHNFNILLITDYGNETHMKSNVFPLMEEVISAVNGQTGPLGTKSWKFEGQSLSDLDSDRLIYSQRFSIIATT